MYNISPDLLIANIDKYPPACKVLKDIDVIASSSDRRELVRFLREQYNEPKKVSDEEVIDRHRKRIARSIN